jgi:site-specific DNA-methyltransferase (adenine-specific)
VNSITLKHQEGLQFLSDVPDNSVDLILTDPPYITSRDSGMDKWVDHVAKQDQAGAKDLRTVADWKRFKTLRGWLDFLNKDNSLFEKNKVKVGAVKRKLKAYKRDYLKYGSIYGKKYAVRTNYGDWDAQFTLEQLELFIKHFYRVLKAGGTCIIFFDLWKITNLKEMLELEKFKQIRLVEWIKTNPQPINSRVNYLTNCREIALLGIKKSKPTFNSKYDNGTYRFPLQGGKYRFHPTQKSLPLFEELIKKHSNEGDLVLDCFAGAATTAMGAKNTNRNFIGCELDETYYIKSMERIENE